MASGGRVDSVEYALRVNAAVEVAASGVGPAEAARLLAGRFGVSVRQARRYVDQAAVGGLVAVPEPNVVFTVKLPGVLAARVRAHARDGDTTISALVARALIEFFSRGRREHPRR
jgi:hypothetical protein